MPHFMPLIEFRDRIDHWKWIGMCCGAVWQATCGHYQLATTAKLYWPIFLESARVCLKANILPPPPPFLLNDI